MFIILLTSFSKKISFHRMQLRREGMKKLSAQRTI